MRLWRVTVVDGQFCRYAGFGVVMADGDTEARAVVAEYLRNDHACGKPYAVSRVEAHESGEPYVAFFNWGPNPSADWRRRSPRNRMYRLAVNHLAMCHGICHGVPPSTSASNGALIATT